jgi:hypothetical protein
MRISGRQLEAIAQAMALESFEGEMMASLRARTPWHAAVLGDNGLRRAIRVGVRRAAVYGVTNVGFLRTYVELMFELGGLFDTDPLLPWAGRALRDAGVEGEAARMDRLYEGAVDYLRAVAGRQARASLDRIQAMLGEDISAERLLAEETALDAMWKAHPTFSAYVGNGPLRDLVRRGPSDAVRLGLGTAGGAALVVAMSFVLGHGFAEDPLYPWIRATLEDASLATPEARVTRLRRDTEQLLEGALRGSN